MELYVGVDGGGTKTEILVLDLQSGKAVVRSGAASNPSTVGFDNAVHTVDSIICEGLAAIHGDVRDVEGVSFCMSGMDRPEQSATMRATFVQKYPHARMEVANDGLAALSAGTRGESGVVLIAGTGSIAVGESWDGMTARAGGYGNLIGDEGGGFDIGRKGLMAAIEYAENRGPKTRLWPIAQEVFQIQQPGEIIPKVYETNHPVGVVASFARYVLEASTQDDCALSIVEESTMHHLRMIESVRSQLGGKVSDNVVLSGGLFTQTRVLRDGLAERLRLALPAVSCQPVAHRPSAGAALRAVCLVHHEQGQPIQPSLLDTWEQAVTDAAVVTTEVPNNVI